MTSPSSEQSAVAPGSPAAQAGVMYVAIATLRNGESALRWHRTSMFVVLNTGFITAVPVITTFAPTPASKAFALWILSLLGVGSSVLWFFITRQANKWVRLWSDKLEAIERCEGFPDVKIFRGPELKALSSGRFAFHNALRVVAGVFLTGWIIAASFLSLTVIYYILRHLGLA